MLKMNKISKNISTIKVPKIEQPVALCKILKKIENSWNKMQYIGFLLLKIWAQIFRISTILEILVTLALHRGYPSDYTST